VARRGAREVAHRDADGDQRTAFFSDDQERRRRTPPPSREPKWERLDGARDEWEDSAPKPARKKAPPAKPPTRSRRPAAAAAAAAAGTRPRGTATSSTAGALAALSNRVSLPPEVAADIRKAADAATTHHRERLVERAESAYGAYERGRFSDALRAIKPVADEAPAVAAVRELAGLAAYRSGRWREAARHLQAFGTLSDSAEHLPVLMDCQRALHKPKKVAELWAELRQSSPEPDVLAEGRIVAAAALADTGDLNGAIAMLATAGASKSLRNPSDRHIRQWYVLGDLYERAGDIPRARDFFERVLRADPEAYDVVQRLRGLGPERRRSRPKTTGSSRGAGAAPKPAPDRTRSS
jgi:tetratricopeptide (TPR) repeat protein